MELKKRILLVDDHKIIREGLRLMLESNNNFEVMDTHSGHDALHIVAGNRIDLVISDLSMDIMNGLELCMELKKNRFNNKIMIFSMNKESEVIRQLLEIGVNGYIFKDSGRSEILAGINSILEDNYYFSNEVATKMTLLHSHDKKLQDELIQLTKREEEILRLISEEYTNKEIGEELFISVRTVDSHRRNLIEKIGAKNTAGLVRFAFQHNLTA